MRLLHSLPRAARRRHLRPLVERPQQAARQRLVVSRQIPVVSWQRCLNADSLRRADASASASPRTPSNSGGSRAKLLCLMLL